MVEEQSDEAATSEAALDVALAHVSTGGCCCHAVEIAIEATMPSPRRVKCHLTNFGRVRSYCVCKGAMCYYDLCVIFVHKASILVFGKARISLRLGSRVSLRKATMEERHCHANLLRFE